MSNYISAELYKLGRKKSLLVGVILLLALESLPFLPSFWKEELGASREILYGFFAAALYPMLALPPLFAAMVFDGQYGYGTLKNEVVYGIPRTRVYLGKLIAGGLVGTLAAAVASGWYILLANLTSRYYMADSLSLSWLLRVLLSHWCIWLALLSFSFLLLTLMRNAAGALALVYVSIILLLPFTVVYWGGDYPLWFRLVNELFFTAPFRYITVDAHYAEVGMLYSLLGEDWLAYSAAVGLFWVAWTTALGMFVFRRREIK